LSNLWPVLAPFLIVDVLNAVLFGFLVYAAGTSRPVINSLMLLLGHTVAYFVAGVLLTIALEPLLERLLNPGTADYAIQLLLGLILLWLVLPNGKRSDEANKTSAASLTPLSSFSLGATVNFVTIPFAIPYAAAISQILKADLSVPESLLVLSVYNLVYALPFVVVPIMVVVACMGERSTPMLQSINEFLVRITGYLLPPFLGLVGVALLVDAGWYFSTGQGLI